MQQLELQYFFPLTEQIPLDLDFTPVDRYYKSRDGYIIKPSGSITLTLGGTGSASYGSTSVFTTMHLEPSKMTVKFDQPVPLYRRMLYNLLGLKVSGK
jgi:hypothetical protein